uniref:Uncharacterized protein n=1 Tax=Lactarius sp. (in: basidiomycete fungi) TaxID=1886493 RepID=A0A2Z4M8W1_9AGAM|nr:hypothetical protein [Lactarius sp. (in: basidiomycete fungi)]
MILLIIRVIVFLYAIYNISGVYFIIPLIISLINIIWTTIYIQNNGPNYFLWIVRWLSILIIVIIIFINFNLIQISLYFYRYSNCFKLSENERTFLSDIYPGFSGIYIFTNIKTKKFYFFEID